MTSHPTIELGHSGLRISRVIFGSMGFGSSRDDGPARIETMRAAIDAGCTTIDTAPLYGYGRIEGLVGEAIANRRSEVQVLTKVGLNWEAPHGQVLFEFEDEHGQRRAVRRNSRPESVRAEVDRSLERLRVDVLDLVQVHHPDPDTPIAETMGALLECKRAGKLRAIGVSNYSAEQMRVAQAALGDTPLASNQVSYSLLELVGTAPRERSACWPEAEILPLARSSGSGVIAYSPLAQGLLGGTRHRGAPPSDWRGQHPNWQRANLTRIADVIDRVVAPIGATHGCGIAEVALAFLLAQPGMSGVIVGASSPLQARRNAAAATVVLSEAELSALRNAFEALRIDPNAGKDLLSRVQSRAKRVLGKLERVVKRLDIGI